MRLPEDKPEYCQCHYEKSAQEGDELPNQHAADTNQEDTSGELCCTEADQEYSDKAVDTISIQERAGMERLKLKVWHRDHLYAVPLPPKAQHRLMVKLQQVMEHACYDFAQREMQKTLDDKEWNHPEAVELDHWMNILIGHDSFDTNKSTEELEALFLSGIEIRDVAVQRTSFGPGRTRELLHNAADILKVLKVGDYLEVVEKLRSGTEQALGQLYLTTMIKRMSIEKERAEIAAELEELEQRKERLDLTVYSSVNECQDIAGCQIMEAIEAAEAGPESTGH